MRSAFAAVVFFLQLGAAPPASAAETKELPPDASPPERALTVGQDLFDLDMRMESTVVESTRLGARLQLDVSWLAGTEKLSDLPVVYVTDGHWRRIDHKYVHYLVARKLIPPVIVVGIGYPEGVDVMRTRTKDFVAAPDPFLAAIRAEIIPWVESRFRCDPRQRILFGASMGGYFSLYTLRQSALAGEPWFLGYVAASSYQGDAALSLGELRGKVVPAQLYLTYGGREDRSGHGMIPPPNSALFRALDNGTPAKLQVVHHLYPQADHYMTTRPTLVDGVRVILGTKEGRGIGFADLSLEHVQYDFRSSVQVYEWEPTSALRAVALSGEGAPALEGPTRSLQVSADFTVEKSGRLSTTFDHFEDLADNELVFPIYVPESLAKLGYEARFFLSSTYQWREDLGEPVKLDRPGWKRLTYSWKGKARAGDPALARSVGVVIVRPEGAPAWKGELFLDGIGW
jgi:predicted alpha/beta superfamily hydrolase